MLPFGLLVLDAILASCRLAAKPIEQVMNVTDIVGDPFFDPQAERARIAAFRRRDAARYFVD